MRLSTSMWLPRPRAEVFPFFSSAANLEAITPPWLHFRILTPQPIAMREGTRIDYRIRLHGIPVTWQTEITVWDPSQRFVDVQRRGPYRKWVHTHTFVEERGGTIVGDEVDFDLAFAWAAGALVARDLRRVFTYRHARLLDAFGRPASSPVPIRIERS